METSPGDIAAVVPLLLRDIIASAFISADKSLLNLAEKYRLRQIYKLLRIFQNFLVSASLFFLGLLPSVFSFLASLFETSACDSSSPKSDPDAPPGDAGEGGLFRVVTHLLAAVSDLPVSSRKYDFVRSLGEILIDENHRSGCEALREINRRALSAAFARRLRHIETAVSEIERDRCGLSWPCADEQGSIQLGTAVRAAGEAVRRRLMRQRGVRSDNSPEKMAAELLWLAEKMAGCGAAEEAAWRWASASALASFGLSADPRLQGSLVKISAFLVKEAAAGLGDGEGKGVGPERQMSRETSAKLVRAWLPLLCGASNGAEAPVLSRRERAEVERALEVAIGGLEQEEQGEMLSLWLRHFAGCPASDWPDLRPAFLRWAAVARKLIVFNPTAH